MNTDWTEKTSRTENSNKYQITSMTQSVHRKTIKHSSKQQRKTFRLPEKLPAPSHLETNETQNQFQNNKTAKTLNFPIQSHSKHTNTLYKSNTVI